MSFMFTLGPMQLDDGGRCVILMHQDEEQILFSDACAPTELSSRLKKVRPTLGKGPIGVGADLREELQALGIATRVMREAEQAVVALQAWTFAQVDEPVPIDPALVLAMFSGLQDFLVSELWNSVSFHDSLYLEIEEEGESARSCVARISGPEDGVFGVTFFHGPGAAELLERGDHDSLDHIVAVDFSQEPEWAASWIDAAFGVELVPRIIEMHEEEVQPITGSVVAVLAATLKALAKLAKGRRVGRAQVRSEDGSTTQVQVSLDPSPAIAPRSSTPKNTSLVGKKVGRKDPFSLDPSPAIAPRSFASKNASLDGKKVGRNDPCPCGSQKKYKKCCLNKRLPTASVPEQELDWKEEVAKVIKRYDSGYYDRWMERVCGEGHDDSSLTGPLMSCLLSGFTMRDGSTPLGAYLKKEGPRLPMSTRQSLRGLESGVLSVWEVVGIERGTGLHIWNMLSGERVFARDKSASRSARMHAGVLARVVHEETHSWIDCLDSRGASPENTQGMIKEIRRTLKVRKKWMDAETLRDPDTMVEILRAWERMQLQAATPPRLRCLNLDGEPATSVEDCYQVKEGQVNKVVDRLTQQPDRHWSVQESEDAVVMTRVGEPDRDEFWTSYVLANLSVSNGKLSVVSCGEERADRLRAWIESLLGADVQFQSRDLNKLEPVVRGDGPTKDVVVEQIYKSGFLEFDEDIAARIQLRRMLYRPQKTLGGLRPVEAVQRASTRREVHLMLSEAEFSSKLDDPGFFERLRVGIHIDEYGDRLTKSKRAARMKEGRSMSDRIFELAYEVLMQTPDSKEMLAVVVAATWVWNVAPMDSPELDPELFEHALDKCMEEISERYEEGAAPERDRVGDWMRKMWGCRWMYPEGNWVRIDSVEDARGVPRLRVLRSAHGVGGR